MIEFSCGNCGSKLNVKDKHSGRRVRCPKCEDVSVVPRKRDRIDFDCGHCGRNIRVRQRHAGKKGKCPKCKKVIVVPSLETESLGIADLVGVVCSVCNKTVRVRQTSIGQIIECPGCGSDIETSARDKQGQSDSSPDEDFYEQSPEEYEEYVAVDRRRIIGISAVAAAVVIGLIILAVVLRSSGSRPAGRPERLRAQQQVADTDSRPAQVTYDQNQVGEWIKEFENKSNRVHVRKEAAELLGKTGDPQAIQSLIKALEDRDYYVRRAAVNALGRTGDPQAAQPLISALDDRQYSVRQAAANALGKIGDPQAVQPLISALDDRQYSVRHAAANALGKIGDPQAVQPLIEALEDKQDPVRQAAANALGKIDDPRAKRAFRKRALGRATAKVGSFVIELLLLCLFVFLSALAWWVLKRRPSIAEIDIRLMSVYLGTVGVVSCATVLIEYVTSSVEGLTPFLARIIVWPACLLRLIVRSRFGAWPIVLFGCLVYYGIIFCPLLKASYLNEKKDGARYSALRRLFIVNYLIPIVLFVIVAICLVVYAIVHIREAPLH